jgi:hypothetical protein
MPPGFGSLTRYKALAFLRFYCMIWRLFGNGLALTFAEASTEEPYRSQNRFWVRRRIYFMVNSRRVRAISRSIGVNSRRFGAISRSMGGDIMCGSSSSALAPREAMLNKSLVILLF